MFFDNIYMHNNICFCLHKARAIMSKTGPYHPNSLKSREEAPSFYSQRLLTPPGSYSNGKSSSSSSKKESRGDLSPYSKPRLMTESNICFCKGCLAFSLISHFIIAGGIIAMTVMMGLMFNQNDERWDDLFELIHNINENNAIPRFLTITEQVINGVRVIGPYFIETGERRDSPSQHSAIKRDALVPSPEQSAIDELAAEPTQSPFPQPQESALTDAYEPKEAAVPSSSYSPQPTEGKVVPLSSDQSPLPSPSSSPFEEGGEEAPEDGPSKSMSHTPIPIGTPNPTPPSTHPSSSGIPSQIKPGNALSSVLYYIPQASLTHHHHFDVETLLSKLDKVFYLIDASTNVLETWTQPNGVIDTVDSLIYGLGSLFDVYLDDDDWTPLNRSTRNDNSSRPPHPTRFETSSSPPIKELLPSLYDFVRLVIARLSQLKDLDPDFILKIDRIINALDIELSLIQSSNTSETIVQSIVPAIQDALKNLEGIMGKIDTGRLAFSMG